MAVAIIGTLGLPVVIARHSEYMRWLVWPWGPPAGRRQRGNSRRLDMGHKRRTRCNASRYVYHRRGRSHCCPSHFVLRFRSNGRETTARCAALAR